jgi:3-dehydroquinate synthase
MGLGTEFTFHFGNFFSHILIQDELPDLDDLVREFQPDAPILLVCDKNTESLAQKIAAGRREIALLTLESGEKEKTWDSVEKILDAGRSAGLGRDGLFIGVGGGVIGDLVGFAASIYMRGAQFCLVSTTLLGMVDAAIGGKTGVNLFGIKNLAGTFFPARRIALPLSVLESLPEREFKSGMAELIKTAVLASDDFLGLVKNLIKLKESGIKNPEYRVCLKECVCRAVAFKGKIVESDPCETGKERFMLNLGHTFGHALEGAMGPGELSHGEAVAWGMVRACELGLALGLTPSKLAGEITKILSDCGHETSAPHPLIKSQGLLWNALQSDKKRSARKLKFIVPGQEGGCIVSAEDFPLLGGKEGEDLIRKIINVGQLI